MSQFDYFIICNGEEIRRLLKTGINILSSVKDSSGRLIIPDKITLPTRKEEMRGLLIKLLSSREAIRAIYERMSEIEKFFVQRSMLNMRKMPY